MKKRERKGELGREFIWEGDDTASRRFSLRLCGLQVYLELQAADRVLIIEKPQVCELALTGPHNGQCALICTDCLEKC